MIETIDVGLIMEHPENSNVMGRDTIAKLRRHIDSTGKYEPLIVRPHPERRGAYQVINGHNRLRVLRALDRATAKCVVWDIDDIQTRLYLATLNRLSGSDIPERRAALVEVLCEEFEIDDLALLLPEDRDQIEALNAISSIDLEELIPGDASDVDSNMPVIISFMFEEDEARQVNLAIDIAVHNSSKKLSRSQALVEVAAVYVKLGNVRTKESANV